MKWDAVPYFEALTPLRESSAGRSGACPLCGSDQFIIKIYSDGTSEPICPHCSQVDLIEAARAEWRRQGGQPRNGATASSNGAGHPSGVSAPLNSLHSLNSFPGAANEGEWPADLAPEAFHGLAGDIVNALAPETEADAAAMLLNVLITFGNAVGRGPYSEVLTTRHGTNLFGALVAATGETKGASWDPIHELFTRALPVYMQERVGGGLASGEGLVALVRDRQERRVQVKDKKTGRMTMEFETVIEDEGIADKRALIVEAEMSSLLKIMNRPGNILSEQLRMAWDKGTLQTMNKNSPMKATGAHISLIGHITPDALLTHLTQADSANGFGNRFVWMLCRRSKYLPEGGVLPCLSKYVVSIKELVELASDKIMIGRQADARRMWAAVYEDLRRSGVGMFGELTARRAPIVARLSLIYALLAGTREILPVHLMAALAVWERSEASVRFLFGDNTGDPTADALYEAMANRPEGASRSDLHAALGRNRPVADLDRALTALQRSGRAIMRRQKGDGGREIEAWYAVAAPKVGVAATPYLQKARAAYENNETNENSGAQIASDRNENNEINENKEGRDG